ncbi:MAG: ABC transporter substrate-binding protein [Mesorhizobium sp.]|uniref:ABC transporter substrate-binding protein n=1 Tax=unclassified Mesorhizobium TaxID=325217 RepID=UPI000F755D5B|nr:MULTISPECIES: ABC transporter substrate-binding protein [unclassified Mesorhizobium]AZO74101.1 ABC transporter substrate-binding protein [Mesorhizobium sp. M1D.F.Ca.ET.043.01.1.1]RWA95129.1 MAG: twin-arginine translocation signal domain-containing protein [Mesorhizobium sp.]RWE05680.1 MAG: twin-arginine translocation signal domain-containing protein [Mesorhizobium sp.]TIW00632.1 MAG: ABC transporter substrate-binding protein [Mesorhizobium sp.]TJW87376.1 MAG: ABC transporter substrate-bindi
MHIVQNRRHFLAGAAAAGAAGLIGATGAWAEPLPETTSVRLPRWINGAYCWAGLYLAGELLRADGFTDVRYIQGDPKLDQSVWIAIGETDFSINYVPVHVRSIDAGVPIRVLGGLHVGCLELLANDRVKTITDLKGKRVGVHDLDAPSYVLVALMAAYVGLDPANDIDWVIEPDKPTKAFADGKFDAYLFTSPQVAELRIRNIGHTILNSTLDRPWSQHFCCMISASAEYVDKHPVATKRVLRAIVKGADLCASDPSWTAGRLVERGFVPSYEIALQTLKDTRYDVWRDYDPEASIRFYALRMAETGMIKSSPQAIINKGTDWRFLDELKRELKT